MATAAKSASQTDELIPGPDAPDEHIIHIPKTREDSSDVFVGFQFQSYQIKRGVNVKVPAGVVEALNLAVETRFEEETVDGKPTMVPRQVPSIPFQVIS